MIVDAFRAYQSHRVGGLRDWLHRKFDHARQHRHLARLDDAALKDLGLSRADVARELAQPFWMRPDFGRISQPQLTDAAHMAQYRQQ
jgi:uncharacterized protein YjiS (DUF1127 family)